MKILNRNNTLELVYSKYRERLAARLIIIKNDRVLLIYSTKYNTYTLPGGGVEEGESLEQTAIREAREETGLNVSIVKKIATVMEVFDEANILNISTCFSGTVIDENDLSPDSESVEEGQELIWIPLNKVEQLIYQLNKDSKVTSMSRDLYFIQQYIKDVVKVD